jgi:hypothetical protein
LGQGKNLIGSFRSQVGVGLLLAGGFQRRGVLPGYLREVLPGLPAVRRPG